jgi:hypothetical protein
VGKLWINAAPLANPNLVKLVVVDALWVMPGAAQDDELLMA